MALESGQGADEQIEFWSAVLLNKGVTTDAVQTAYRSITAAFSKIELFLLETDEAAASQGDVYILGRAERPSMVDIAWFVYALRMQSLGYDLASNHPRFADLYNRLRLYHPVFEEEASRSEVSLPLRAIEGLKWVRGITLSNVADRSTVPSAIVRWGPVLAVVLCFALLVAQLL